MPHETSEEIKMDTRATLLSSLKSKKGSWVSGESLSLKIGVTRAALWKHVHALKEEGYEIESSPKKGYLLHRVPDLLLPAEILEGLGTKIFGRSKIHYFAETGSTNEEAKDLAEKGTPEGTVVIAEGQVQGKGRRGRTWFSPQREGIYCSLILRPKLTPPEASRITLLTAVAVADLLRSFLALPCKVKWPNDILVNGRKIAGILTEASMEMDMINYLVIGLGLNVNLTAESFPEDLRNKATSILIETGSSFSRVRLVQGFLSGFEKLYETLLTQGFRPILDRWEATAEILGRRIQVDLLDQSLKGTVSSVDPDGALILRDDGGNLHRILSGDVIFLEPFFSPPAGNPGTERELHGSR